MQKYPLKLKGFVANYIWGGEKLAKFWGKQGEQIAESWEFSFYPKKESIISNGALVGVSLAELLAMYPKWLGRAAEFKPFPLLIKLIDAAQDLSVQVHPSDEYALRVEGGYGKTEMWYVADVEQDSYIYYGLKRNVDKGQLLQSIKENSVESLLNKVKIKKGDCIFIPSGTLHAINAGATIVEIQQNSNITYRVYDYNRKDAQGNTRELHIEKAVQVSNLGITDTQNIKNYSKIEKNTSVFLGGCKYFKSYIMHLHNQVDIGDNGSFCALTIVEGGGEIEGEQFSKGDTYLLPCGYYANLFSQDARLLITKVGEN